MEVWKGYRCASHVTMVFVKTIIQLLQCLYSHCVNQGKSTKICPYLPVGHVYSQTLSKVLHFCCSLNALHWNWPSLLAEFLHSKATATNASRAVSKMTPTTFFIAESTVIHYRKYPGKEWQRWGPRGGFRFKVEGYLTGPCGHTEYNIKETGHVAADHIWQGGSPLAGKCGLQRTSFGCQKLSPQTIFGSRKWSSDNYWVHRTTSDMTGQPHSDQSSSIIIQDDQAEESLSKSGWLYTGAQELHLLFSFQQELYMCISVTQRMCLRVSMSIKLEHAAPR